MKKLLLFFLLTSITQLTFAQIFTLDFDANNTGYTSGPDGFGNDGATATDYYDISATGFGGSYNGSDGNFFAAQDIDGVTGFTTDVQIFEINGIDITGATALTLAIDLSEDDDGSNQDWDSDDQFLIEARIDGGAYTTILEVGATGTNSEPFIEASTNAGNIGTPITNVFANFLSEIPGTGSTLDIRITIELNFGDEDIAFDNLIISDSPNGVPGITVTDPLGNTSETGTTTTFTVVLDNSPTSNVVLDVTSGDTGENTVSPATVTFTTTDWDQPQTITVTGVDDTDIDGNQTTTMTVATNDAMSADEYDGLSQTVDVINENDDESSITNEDVRINEVDADQAGTDSAEFIELFGTPNLALDGLVVVLYNGGGDVSYSAYDLDGYSLDANGFLLIGQEGAIDFTAEIFLNSSKIQNGADAVALYVGNGSDFPNGTPISQAGLIDALVHKTGESDDAGLNALIENQPFLDDATEEYQVDEDLYQDSENHSIQRGSWFVSAPTPRLTNVLPVDFISFEGTNKNGKSILTWATAQEVNNEKFEIERSTDTEKFETIGTVKGNGNTNSISEYSFTDEEPMIGTNYYRLKQVDLDGAFDYSEVVKVDFTRGAFTISPTRTNNTVTITNGTSKEFTLELIANDGRVISKKTTDASAEIIDMTMLKSGLYYIRIQSNQVIFSEKIIKI